MMQEVGKLVMGGKSKSTPPLYETMVYKQYKAMGIYPSGILVLYQFLHTYEVGIARIVHIHM